MFNWDTYEVLIVAWWLTDRTRAMIKHRRRRRELGVLPLDSLDSSD